jgi:CHAT domain-containing protein
MRKLSLIAIFILCCSTYSPLSFSAISKGDGDVENLKAPPRDIKDILRTLRETKPNLVLQQKAQKIIEAPKPNVSDPEKLSYYYYRKAKAYEALGDDRQALENIKKVVNEYPNVNVTFSVEDLRFYGILESSLGNVVQANEIFKQAQAKATDGWLLDTYDDIGKNCLLLGDFDCANKSLEQMEAFRSRRNPSRVLVRLNWDSKVDRLKARIFLDEGRFTEAEISLKRAEYNLNEIAQTNKNRGFEVLDLEARGTEEASFASAGAFYKLINVKDNLAKSYLGQKRLIDAELKARNALSLALDRSGPNSRYTATTLMTLSQIISEQGRNAEAVLLAEAALKATLESGVGKGSVALAEARKLLASAYVVDGNFIQADKVFSEMVQGIKSDPQLAGRYQTDNLDWALALIKTGKASQAVTMTSAMLARDGTRLGSNSAQLALIRSFNAAALQASGQGAQALPEFKKAIPTLIDQARNDSEASVESVRQVQQFTFVLEGYLASLAQQTKADSSGASAAIAFQIADLAKGSGVQKALTASAARANIADPKLAQLARSEQDLQQRIKSLSSLLVDLLAAAPDQQLPAVQAKIRTDLTTFKSQRDDLKKEIEKKYPDYAELVEPKPASVERTQKALKPDEVLISWYFGDNVGYVWAITKDKPAQFAQLSIGRTQMAKEVAQLRKALDPGVATIDEIPAFDVVLANQLYQQVLAPVQSAFAGKKVMLTVPHAELGQLPLSLLVTKSTAQPVKGGATPFIGYKTVPWLTRDIAVAQVPSVTALTALRSLPAGNPNRKNFIGFGDPYFSTQQEQQADKQVKATQLSTRGVPLNLRSAPKTSGVSSAELALLPRLPDTSLELEEIGKAIGAGDGDIFLHKQASVKQVMATDLSNRKVVMFATHGLVPGELNGLTQPALALSSPDVTGDKDDGLLTMDKVLTLKLDADWVVLSACNTAAGEGAGSEAVSGLGRAFFFAGAKALLVSNWPVDSVASRQLMTDLFKRQQENKSLQKSEALRQAMLAQIDQGGVRESNTMKYSYAHPLFWAPFVVVGD